MKKFNRSQILEIIESLTPGCSYTRVLNFRYPGVYDEMVKHWYSKYQHDFSKPLDVIYCYIHPDRSFICPYGYVKKSQSLHQSLVCNKSCRCSLEKKQETMLSKYGTKHALQNSKIREKFTETLEERYNTDSLYQAGKEKRKETNLQKFGVEFPLQSKKVQDKIKQSCSSSLGVERPFKSELVQEKIQNHWLNKNGRRTYIKSNEQNELIHRDKLTNLFGEKSKFLTDQGLFTECLKDRSREQLASFIGCSVSLIDKRIKEWELDEFQKTPSYYQVLIEKFLSENNVEYVKNDRRTIKPLELDFYLPKYNLAIEFHGLKWHSENFGKKNRSYHLTKHNKSCQSGIRLIQIFQDEWDNSSEIIKSILLNSLGLISNRIAARKCTIREINSNDAKKFLDCNHIQKASIGCFCNIGLYYKNELVSVMSFKRTKQGIELSRFANLIHCVVHGSASKMFRYFVNRYNPEEVYTFSDVRLFSGKLYKTLGFMQQHQTQPNYYYFIKANQKYHRLQFTKKKLVSEGYDERKTEWEIMKERGYDRVWDCGHIRYIWRKM